MEIITRIDAKDKQGTKIMWTKRLLLAIVLLGISLCCPTDKISHGVQAATNDFDCTTVSEIPQLECEALVDLYNSTDGPNWRDSRGWLVTTTPCGWFGVICNDGSVATLDLSHSSNRLSGVLPATIENFTNLTRLNLSINGFESRPAEIGFIKFELLSDPNQLSSLPTEIGNLSKLTELCLRSIEISG